MSKRMRANRRHHERGYGRHEHWTACRQGIRRGASRGSNDDAVSLAVENKDAINDEVEIHQAGDGAFVHYRIVQREVMRQALAISNQAAIEHRAFFARAGAGIDRLQRGVHFGKRNFREESQRAKINRQDGNTFVRYGAGSGEQRTVAPEHEREIRVLLADRLSAIRPRPHWYIVPSPGRDKSGIHAGETTRAAPARMAASSGFDGFEMIATDFMYSSSNCVSVTRDEQSGHATGTPGFPLPRRSETRCFHIRTSKFFHAFGNSRDSHLMSLWIAHDTSLPDLRAANLELGFYQHYQFKTIGRRTCRTHVTTAGRTSVAEINETSMATSATCSGCAGGGQTCGQVR